MCNNNVKLLNVHKLLNLGIIMTRKLIGTGFSRPLGNAKHEKRKEQKIPAEISDTRTVPLCN